MFATRARGLAVGLAGLALAAPGAAADRPVAAPPRASFTVVPPGPVGERARVELRLAVRNDSPRARSYRVAFYLDRFEMRRRIAECTMEAAPGGWALARAWWPAAGHSGRRLLRYRVESEGAARSGAERIEVLRSDGAAPPLLAGAWIEPGAVLQTCRGKDAAETERNVRKSVDAMAALGMRTLIVAYVEAWGTFYFPSSVEFHDAEAKRMSRGRDCPFDVIGTLLSQADRHDMRVMLGVGRSGDTNLLWEFDKPGWTARNAAALAIARRVAGDLWRLYGRHRSFYGWYSTHEMNDLARSSAYLNPLADFCHALSPDRPFLTAPAGTPIITKESLAASKVDIFAYQDAVGTGYVPHVYTWQPERRIAMLDTLFREYADLHRGSGKHLWADLEVWEMDGKSGYSNAYPAAFSRVRRQIAIESRYAEALTAYAWHGYLQAPGGQGASADPRAVRLYEAYREHVRSVRAGRAARTAERAQKAISSR